MAKNILLIEDHPETIDIYKELFKKEGFNLEIIDSGEKVLQKIKRLEEEKEDIPSLILLDLMLPNVTGDKLLKNIRSNPLLEDTPVFIFTNYTDPQQKENLEKLGIEKFITKTAQTPLEFVKMIKKWFEEKEE